MLSLRMLIRTWRGGELGLILWSLILAVAVVTSVSLLAERIEKALTQESSSFLAADLVVRSSKEAPIEWVEEAARLNVSTAKIMGFASIVFFGDELHLASIKAVQSNYPLAHRQIIWLVYRQKHELLQHAAVRRQTADADNG